jgi:hypothetical protein
MLHVLPRRKRDGSKSIGLSQWMQYPTHHNASQKGVFDIFLRILKPTPSLCLAALSAR